MGGVSGSPCARSARAVAFHRRVRRAAWRRLQRAAWARKANVPSSEILWAASRMGTLLQGLSGYSMALRESADSVSPRRFNPLSKSLSRNWRQNPRLRCDGHAVNLPSSECRSGGLMHVAAESDRQLAAFPVGGAAGDPRIGRAGSPGDVGHSGGRQRHRDCA